MRTHGHREASITYWGLSVGNRGGTAVGLGGWGGTTWGEMPDIVDRGMEAANHTITCVPMQLSCMFFTCTPKPKMQLKKEKKIIKIRKLTVIY